jgi:hypothetical protein
VITTITRFESDLLTLLPATRALLHSAGLAVHPAVERIALHGSRGLAGGFRPHSDVDLSLILAGDALPVEPERAALLREVLNTTLQAWRCPVELDLAAVFDVRGCGLVCFERTRYAEDLCQESGAGCFGLFKVQRGFDGYVAGPELQIKRMYPSLVIWRRPSG